MLQKINKFAFPKILINVFHLGEILHTVEIALESESVI